MLWLPPKLAHMKLNHLNIVVPDLAEASTFFEQQLGFIILTDKPGIKILRDETDFILVLSQLRQSPELPQYPQDFHIGFRFDNRAEVDRMYEQLASAGFDVGDAPRKVHGSYSWYFRAFGCLLIEFTIWEQG